MKIKIVLILFILMFCGICYAAHNNFNFSMRMSSGGRAIVGSSVDTRVTTGGDTRVTTGGDTRVTP